MTIGEFAEFAKAVAKHEEGRKYQQDDPSYPRVEFVDGVFCCEVGVHGSWGGYGTFDVDVSVKHPDLNTALDMLRDKWMEKHGGGGCDNG